MSGLAMAFDVLARDKASKTFDKVADSADKAGKKGKDFGEKFKKGMAVALGAVGVGGAAAVAAFAGALDMSSANAKLSAQLGISGDLSAKAGAMAGELYANNYGASLDEVNDAVRSVAQNITGTSAIGSKGMQDLTADVLSVASAFDQDLAGTTAAVGQLMKTGLAKNSQEALDIITTGFQRGVNKADDLLDTFTEYSTVFRDIGISGKDATGLMSQGLKAGARDADTVADALKELAIRGQDGSKTSAAGFKAIGLSADKMTAAFAKGGPAAREATDKVLDGLRGIEDPAKRNAAAVQLFGTKAEDLGDALFNLDLDTAATGLGKVDGAAKKVNDTLSATPASKIETFKRSLQTTFTNVIGGTVIPKLEEFADWLGPKLGSAIDQAKVVIGNIATALQDAGKWISENKTLVGSLVAALSAGLAVWGAWRAYIAITAAVTKAYIAVQVALNAVMSANPIGLVVIAIAALAAGLIYAYQNSETFRSYVTTAFSMVKIGALTLAGVAVGAFQKLVNFWFIVVGGILDGAAKAFGWVPGVGPKLQEASKAFGQFRESANRELNAIQDDIQVNIKTEQARIALEELHREFINKGWTVTAQARVNMVYAGNGVAVPARAHGGPVRAGGIYAVGDNPDGSWNATTELFVPNTSGRIYNQQQLASAGSSVATSGGGRMHPADLAEMKAALRAGAREGTAAGFGFQSREASYGSRV